MKRIMTSILFMASTQVMAAAAMEYKCTGVNKLDRSAVELNIAFSDYDREAGYTNQSIQLTQVNGQEVTNVPALQMMGADSSNSCGQAIEGEIYLNPKNYSMSAPTDRLQSGGILTLKSDCAQVKLDVVAVCQLDF